MNVHQSRPQGLDNAHYSQYHQQQQQQLQQSQRQVSTWSSMLPNESYGRAGNSYDRPLQSSQSYNHQQQQQQQQTLVYAPPQAPHLSNRHYQPLANPYYPVVYSTPYPIAPAQYYPQQSRHAFANSTGYSAQRPTAFYVVAPPAPRPSSTYRGNEQQQLGFSRNYAPSVNFSQQLAQQQQQQQQQQAQQERSYSQDRMRSQSRGRWNGQQSTSQSLQQQSQSQLSERSQSNESIWTDGGNLSRESSGRMSEADLTRMSSSITSFTSSSISSSKFNSTPEDIWNVTYRKESSVDLDHPSFDRPPHRTSISNVQPIFIAPEALVVSALTTPQVIESINKTDNIEYDLIPNLSPVPPPPAIEFSAVPLSDLATEMVWEACVLAVAADHSSNRWARVSNKPPSLFNEVADANRRLRLDSEDTSIHASLGTSLSSTRSSSPFNSVPELYGAIGEGRRGNRARKLSNTTSSSNESSPSSSTPGTPAGVGAMEDVAARRMMGFGFGLNQSNTISERGKNAVEFDSRSSIDSTLDGFRSSALGGGGSRRFQQSISPLHPSKYSSSSSSSQSPSSASPTTPPASPSFPTEPSIAFRQFVKQILTATLVAPEDLVLALYYVASIPSTSMIPPMVNESRGNAIKAAPFKIVLGALMLANKTLQDNSYRNETFAAVSGIPLKDVNDLEVFVFGALGFDVAVRGDIWKTWLSVIRERASSSFKRSSSASGGGDLGNRFEVNRALDKLWKLAMRESFTPVRYDEEFNPGLEPSFEVLVKVASYLGGSEKEEGEIDEDDVGGEGEGEEDVEMGLGEFEGPLKPKTPLRTSSITAVTATTTTTTTTTTTRNGSTQLEPLRFNHHHHHHQYESRASDCRSSIGGGGERRDSSSQWELPRRQSNCAR